MDPCRFETLLFYAPFNSLCMSSTGNKGAKELHCAASLHKIRLKMFCFQKADVGQ